MESDNSLNQLMLSKLLPFMNKSYIENFLSKNQISDVQDIIINKINDMPGKNYNLI